MPLIALIAGDILLAVGILGYVLSNFASVTALIPAGFGAIMNLCGVIAMARPATRKHAMHAAAVVALLGFGGTVRGLAKLPALLGGQDVERPAAVASQAVTAIVCLVFLILCVQSFIRARSKPAEASQR